MLPLQTGTQRGTKAQRNIAASCPDEQNSTNGTMAQMAAGPQWHKWLQVHNGTGQVWPPVKVVPLTNHTTTSTDQKRPNMKEIELQLTTTESLVIQYIVFCTPIRASEESLKN